MDKMLYRELSPLELEIVAGGIISEDPVTSWGWNNSYDVENNGSGNWEDYWDVPPDNGGGGGGGESEDEACTCATHTAQEVENRTDALASKLASDIRAKADFQSREYVAVVYRDAEGRITVGELFPGNLTSAPLGAAVNAVGGPGNIIGVVHNHPQGMVDRSADTVASGEINKMPSNGDWSNALTVFGSRTDVAYYVLGPDSVLREYELSDRAMWDARNEYNYWKNHQRSYTTGPTIDSTLQPPVCPTHG